MSPRHCWLPSDPRATQRRADWNACQKEFRNGGRRPAWRRAGVWTFRAGVFALPEGDLRIARQFTAGFRCDIQQVPKGRLNPANVLRQVIDPFLWQKFSRPFGTRCPHSTIPPFKGWAILKSPSGRPQTNSLCCLRNGGPKNVQTTDTRLKPVANEMSLGLAEGVS